AVVGLLGAGYVAGRGPFVEPRGGRVPGTPWGVRVAIAGGLVVAALIAAWTIWQPLRSDQADDAALNALSKNNVAAAYVNITRARATAEQNQRARQATPAGSPTAPATPSARIPAAPSTTPRAPSTGGTRPKPAP